MKATLTKRLFALFAALLFTLTLLAACGGSSNQPVSLITQDAAAIGMAIDQQARDQLDTYLAAPADAPVTRQIISAQFDRVIMVYGDFLLAYNLNTDGQATLHTAIDLRQQAYANRLPEQAEAAAKQPNDMATVINGIEYLPIYNARFVTLRGADWLYLADMDQGVVYSLPGYLGTGAVVHASPRGKYLAVGLQHEQTQAWHTVLIDIAAEQTTATLVYTNKTRPVIDVTAGDDGQVVVTHDNPNYQNAPQYYYISRAGATPQKLMWNSYNSQCIGVDATCTYLADDYLRFLRPHLREKGLPAVSDFIMYLGESTVMARYNIDGAMTSSHIPVIVKNGKVSTDTIINHPDTDSDTGMVFYAGLSGVIAVNEKGHVKLWRGDFGFSRSIPVGELGVFPATNDGGAMAVGMQYIIGFTAQADAVDGIQFFVYFSPDNLMTNYAVA